MTESEQSPKPGGGGEPAGPARKVLIIGLDGATFDVLRPLMDEGFLPRLAAAVQGGCAGVLHSTVPPITPAAWTTFLTGVQPGSHGIIDFERYDPGTNRLVLNSTRSLDHVRNLWQILSDRGLRVGSVNVPMTYPPIPVNGFMISGFETPSPLSPFAYPAELQADVLKRWPDPTSKARWQRRPLGGDALFAANVDYMARSYHQGAALTRYCGERYGWDVLMVVMKLVDNLQHKAWKYIDPRWRDRSPRRRDMVRDAFAQMDRAVGDLLDYAAEHEAAVLMVSDHGHGSLEGQVMPNQLLARWGYLALRDSGTRAATRLRKHWYRLTGRKSPQAEAGDIGHDLAVDFSRTRACVMHAGMAGFVYLNLAERQPGGIVSPAEYDTLRDELRERFLSDECQVRTPSGETWPMFTAVHKPEELYGCTRADQPWLPDLMLTPHDGLAVMRKIRGSSPVRWLSYRRLEGTHRPQGILIATGPGVASGRKVDAHIVDCLPTVLTLLGQAIPAAVEGQVIDELFASPPKVVREAPGAKAAAAARPSAEASQEAYSEAELEAVKARLSDLGYLQ